MSTSKIKYLGNLRTSAAHLKSGNEIITDAPVDNNGKGEAFSPTDLVATALGSCMLTIIGISANKHNIFLGEISVQITKIMQSGPRKIKEIHVDFEFDGTNYTDKEKLIIKKAAETCPVALSLDKNVTQKLSFNF